MLELIESELRDAVYTAATEFIMQVDRSRFDSVFSVIEDFTINNNGIIGGVNGINMLASVPKSKDSYMYEIYIADVEKNARALTDLLYNSEHKYIDKNTLRLETKLRNRIYELWVDARLIARMYALVDYRGIKLFMLLNPVRAYGYFPGGDDIGDKSTSKKKIYAMSSEIQLLDIYRRLYNPYPTREVISYDTYDTLLDYENKLYNIIAEDIIKRASGIEQDIMSVTRAEGGGASVEKSQEKEMDGGAQLHSIVPIIAKKLIPELAKINSKTIIVGDYALRQIMPNYPYQERLQILTTESMENMKKLLTKMLDDKDIKRGLQSSAAKITGVKYPLNLPNDIMMEKFSLYLDLDGSQAYICDVFNSPSYELIPCKVVNSTAGPIKYANLVVCLRFKFIDLYVSRLINNIREGKDEFIIKKINQIARVIKMVREKLFSMIENDPLDVFSVNYEDYEGTFVKPNVMLRMKISELLGGKKIHYNYFPHSLRS